MIQRKFLLVALNPLLAFSLMFSKSPGFVCSPSFLNSWSSTSMNCQSYELQWSIVVFTITFVHCHFFQHHHHHHIPAQYDGHVTGVTESELVSWLAYACQRRIALNCNKVECSLISFACWSERNAVLPDSLRLETASHQSWHTWSIKFKVKKSIININQLSLNDIKLRSCPLQPTHKL